MSSFPTWAWWGGAVATGLLLSRPTSARTASTNPTTLDSERIRRQEPSTAGRHKPLLRTFDPIFRRYGHGLPVAYLRALAKRESDFNPSLSDGPAWGILQVVEVVRRDYNDRHSTTYARADLLDPTVCTEIAADLLARIVTSYSVNHPIVPNLKENWDNPRFVELVTFGWNAGYSQKGGVGKVARYLTERGRATDVTIDSVFAAASEAGASHHLSNEKKVAWCKSVARLYTYEEALEPTLT